MKEKINQEMRVGQELLKLLNDLFAECKKEYPSLNKIKFLVKSISSGININSIDEFDRTCLHWLCAQDNPNLEAVKYLIEMGANPLIRDIDDCNCLMLSGGNKQLTNCLSTNFQIQLLFEECKKKKPSLEMINQLSDKIDINSIDKFDRTCLHWLCDQDNPNLEAVKYLIEKGANPLLPDIDNYSCFGLADLRNNKQLHTCLFPSEVVSFCKNFINFDKTVPTIDDCKNIHEVTCFLMNKESWEVNLRHVLLGILLLPIQFSSYFKENFSEIRHQLEQMITSTFASSLPHNISRLPNFAKSESEAASSLLILVKRMNDSRYTSFPIQKKMIIDILKKSFSVPAMLMALKDTEVESIKNSMTEMLISSQIVENSSLF